MNKGTKQVCEKKLFFELSDRAKRKTFTVSSTPFRLCSFYEILDFKINFMYHLSYLFVYT